MAACLGGRGSYWTSPDADELCGRRPQNDASRRCWRRSVGGAVAAGAYYAPGCVQVVDVYGQVYTRC